MEEIKYGCLNLGMRAEDVAIILRELPTDYVFAERCVEIDREIEEILNWYNTAKCQKEIMEGRLKQIEHNLKILEKDVEEFKLQELSHVRHGGSYSQLPQIQRP